MTDGKKDSTLAIDAAQMLEEMEEMERWNGVTKDKIVDNWYAVKNKIAQAIMEKQKEKKE